MAWMFKHIQGYDPIEKQIERAEHSIEDLQSPEKEWCIKLLNILKNGQYARVVGESGRVLDVVKIAHTYLYASFFDVINRIHLYDKH